MDKEASNLEPGVFMGVVEKQNVLSEYSYLEDLPGVFRDYELQVILLIQNFSYYRTFHSL